MLDLLRQLALPIIFTGLASYSLVEPDADSQEMPASTNYKDIQDLLEDEGHVRMPSGSVIAIVAATKKALQPFRNVKNSTKPTDVISQSLVVMIEKTIEFDSSLVPGDWEMESLYKRLYSLILDDATYGDRVVVHISTKPDWSSVWDSAMDSLEMPRPKRRKIRIGGDEPVEEDPPSRKRKFDEESEGHSRRRKRMRRSSNSSDSWSWNNVESVVSSPSMIVGAAAMTIIAYLSNYWVVFAVSLGVSTYTIFSFVRRATSLVVALVSTAVSAAGLVLPEDFLDDVFGPLLNTFSGLFLIGLVVFGFMQIRQIPSLQSFFPTVVFPSMGSPGGGPAGGGQPLSTPLPTTQTENVGASTGDLQGGADSATASDFATRLGLFNSVPIVDRASVSPKESRVLEMMFEGGEKWRTYESVLRDSQPMSLEAVGWQKHLKGSPSTLETMRVTAHMEVRLAIIVSGSELQGSIRKGRMCMSISF